MSSSMSEMSDGKQKSTSFNEDNDFNIHEFPLSAFTLTSAHHAHTYHPIFPPSPSPVLTLQFRAAVLAAVVLTVVGAVRHLRDADQELAVVPEDHHGQFAPALLHQVLGLQQG